MNSKDTIKLWSHLKKEDYLRILKDKTYEYTLTNTYMANTFLCKVQDDQIYVYYTGKIVGLGGFKGFEAYIKEWGEGIMLEGRFAIARHVKLLWSPFFIFMWIGILWFIIRAPHMGIIIIPYALPFGAYTLAQGLSGERQEEGASITILKKDGFYIRYYFDLDDREMETYMYKLCECAPFFYFGYSDQLYNVYVNDRARMIENVEKARARYFQDHHLN